MGKSRSLQLYHRKKEETSDENSNDSEEGPRRSSRRRKVDADDKDENCKPSPSTSKKGRNENEPAQLTATQESQTNIVMEMISEWMECIPFKWNYTHEVPNPERAEKVLPYKQPSDKEMEAENENTKNEHEFWREWNAVFEGNIVGQRNILGLSSKDLKYWDLATDILRNLRNAYHYEIRRRSMQGPCVTTDIRAVDSLIGSFEPYKNLQLKLTDVTRERDEWKEKIKGVEAEVWRKISELEATVGDLVEKVKSCEGLELLNNQISVERDNLKEALEKSEKELRRSKCELERVGGELSKKVEAEKKLELRIIEVSSDCDKLREKLKKEEENGNQNQNQNVFIVKLDPFWIRTLLQ